MFLLYRYTKFSKLATAEHFNYLAICKPKSYQIMKQIKNNTASEIIGTVLEHLTSTSSTQFFKSNITKDVAYITPNTHSKYTTPPCRQNQTTWLLSALMLVSMMQLCVMPINSGDLQLHLQL